MNMLRDTTNLLWSRLAIRRCVHNADRRKAQGISGSAGVNSNRTTGTAIALAQARRQSARSSLCRRIQRTEANNDLEKPSCPPCNRTTTESHRDRIGVRTFLGCSLHFGNGEEIKIPAQCLQMIRPMALIMTSDWARVPSQDQSSNSAASEICSELHFGRARWLTERREGYLAVKMEKEKHMTTPLNPSKMNRSDTILSC